MMYRSHTNLGVCLRHLTFKGDECRSRWGPVPERNKELGKTRRKHFLNSWK